MPQFYSRKSKPNRNRKEEHVVSLSHKINLMAANLRAAITTRKLRHEHMPQIYHFVHHLTGVHTGRPRLYLQALTHASYRDAEANNERLEFLGDAILSSIVCHTVYDYYPTDNEGSLTQLRSYLVSRKRINSIALSLGFDSVVRVGPGVDMIHSDILGNALEAFIGALFVDRGYAQTAHFVRKRLIVSRKSLDEAYNSDKDAKTAFVIMMQKHKLPYSFVYTDSHEDSDGNQIHTCALNVGDPMQIVSHGEGKSKKLAHQMAARKALEIIRQHPQLLQEWSRKGVTDPEDDHSQSPEQQHISIHDARHTTSQAI